MPNWADENGRFWYRPHGGIPIEIPHPPVVRLPDCDCAVCAPIHPVRKPRTDRIIDRLRVVFPEVEWTYDRPVWRSSAGWYVVRTHELAGGDDVFHTVLRRSDTGEAIHLDRMFRTT